MSPILKDLHWLPVKNRVQFKILMHTYNALHEQAISYISDMLIVYRPRRTLCSMGSVALVVKGLGHLAMVKEISVFSSQAMECIPSSHSFYTYTVIK